MRAVRIVGTLISLAAIGLVPQSVSASTPRPVCDLLTDASGDVSPAPPGLDNADFDVLSADVATNKRYLTVVLRLADLSLPKTAEVVGGQYAVDFSANGANFELMADVAPSNAAFDAAVMSAPVGTARSGTDLGSIVGVADRKRHEIRMTAPLSLFRPYATFTQTFIGNISAFAARATVEGGTTAAGKVSVGWASQGTVVDDASTNRTYKPGAASCVVVGR